MTKKSKKISLVLFGGNTKKQDGPLLEFAKLANKKGCKITVITEKLHLNLPTKDGSFLKVKLENSGFDWIEKKNLTLQYLKKNIDKNSIGISLNSIWIFNDEIINFFNGNLYNYHDTPLPEFRGAAAYSWLILLNQKKWGITMHKVVPSLDVGNIVKQHFFIFPKSCRIPQDYLDYKIKFEKKFFSTFLDTLFSKNLKINSQNNKSSTYWPRLITPYNGFINWNWSAKEIELFIRAFDDPHQGSSTFIDGKKVKLKKCFFQKTKTFHPFQSGIIYRIDQGKLFVAGNGGTLKINDVFDLYGKKINHILRVGHRFHTPIKDLETALTTRANNKIIEKIESKIN